MRCMIRHKYNAKKTVYQGVKYDSKLEAQYAKYLERKKESGDLIFYLRQVPFELPGNVKYRSDFMEFWHDGTVCVVDCKGLDTPMSKLKRKQVEGLYPIEIKIITRENIRDLK